MEALQFLSWVLCLLEIHAIRIWRIAGNSKLIVFNVSISILVLVWQ